MENLFDMSILKQISDESGKHINVKYLATTIGTSPDAIIFRCQGFNIKPIKVKGFGDSISPDDAKRVLVSYYDFFSGKAKKKSISTILEELGLTKNDYEKYRPVVEEKELVVEPAEPVDYKAPKDYPLIGNVDLATDKDSNAVTIVENGEITDTIINPSIDDLQDLIDSEVFGDGVYTADEKLLGARPNFNPIDELANLSVEQQVWIKETFPSEKKSKIEREEDVVTFDSISRKIPDYVSDSLKEEIENSEIIPDIKPLPVKDNRTWYEKTFDELIRFFNANTKFLVSDGFIILPLLCLLAVQAHHTGSVISYSSNDSAVLAYFTGIFIEMIALMLTIHNTGKKCTYKQGLSNFAWFQFLMNILYSKFWELWHYVDGVQEIETANGTYEKIVSELQFDENFIFIIICKIAWAGILAYAIYLYSDLFAQKKLNINNQTNTTNA